MNLLYQERSKAKIDGMRGNDIDDPTYDIQKLQNRRKYENQKSYQRNQSW